ncbi:MAG: type II secretion system F family protein [Alphaproteobacteria bacterium]
MVRSLDPVLITLQQGLRQGRPLPSLLIRLRQHPQVETRRIAQKCHHHIMSGHSLSFALRPFLSSDTYLLVAILEKRGAIDKALALVIERQRKWRQLRQRCWPLFITPLVLFIGLVAISLMLKLSILPTLKTVPNLPQESLAWLEFLVRFLLRDLPILICISLTLAGLALKFHAVWVGPVRTLVDMFTPMRLLAHIRGLMVNRILMESLEHGGRFEPTLRTLLEQADPWLSSRLHPLHSRIMAGHHISAALQLMPWKMVPQNLIDIWAVTSSEHLDLMRDTQNEWETSLLTKLEYAVAWLRTAMLIAAASLLGSTAWILHFIQTSLR